MSRIYKHGHYPSELTMDNVNSIVDVVSLGGMIQENERRGYHYD